MRRRFGVLATTAVIAAGVAAPASAGLEPEVRTFSTGDSPELVKTIPITRERGARPKVVMRIDAGRLGPVQAGDRFLSGAEVEVTTCLDAPSGPDTCVGKPYPYDPHVAAKIVLAREPGSAKGEVIGEARQLECSQHHPNRNHHCVLVLPWQAWVADEDCGGCHVNLVMTAWKSGQARDGHELVIGSHSSSSPIDQDKGQIGLVRFRNGALPRDVEPKLGSRRATRIPVASESGTPKRVIIHSAKLTDLDPGDEIYVAANSKTAISRLGYNVLLQSRVYLGRGRNADDHIGTGNYVAPDGQISKLNGFNCTQGRSAHRTPCNRPKLGVARIIEHINELHVIVALSGRAMLNESNPGAWDPGDVARIKESVIRAFVHRA
jgi:hypothetical protein